ncbi:MAG: FkbM family methyltransferase [Magnetococcales bacterium]|nr:FkbM family methyltransferase [Magnetococcales bacterium]
MAQRLPLFQNIVLRLHVLVKRSGFLASPPGQWLFETTYLLYKRFFEARNVAVLQQWIPSDTWAIDVGANIGFFTVYFAHWVHGSGRVVALEPESVNFKRLQRRLATHPERDRVELLQMAAAEKNGWGWLQLNPDHPADHRLSHSGVSVPLSALDTLMAERGWPKIALIKIDVQGAEDRVIMGAQELIRRFHPALLVELTLNDPGSLRTMTLLASFNYRPHRLLRDGTQPFHENELENLLKRKGYIDCLYLYYAGSPKIDQPGAACK